MSSPALEYFVYMGNWILGKTWESNKDMDKKD
jgi:hypothetical protein